MLGILGKWGREWEGGGELTAGLRIVHVWVSGGRRPSAADKK